MSLREKRLLVLFGIAGFLVLNFIGFKVYHAKRQEGLDKLAKAKRELDTARLISASREQVVADMEWLAEHEPEPVTNQDAQTELQKFCESQAKSTGLDIRLQRPLPSDRAEGNDFHRVKFQFTLTGSEKSLYQWFDRINMPTELRIATQIRLAPNKEDDTKIDCTAIVEQWFIPLPPSN